MNFKPVKEDGFTLIEVTIAMALMAIAGLIGMEVLNMIRKTSEKTLRANGHLEFHVEMVKTLNQGITGVKGFEQDDHLFYSTNGTPDFVRTSTSMSSNELNKYKGAERKITSHRFRKRLDTHLIEYYSVCIPKNEARTFQFKNVDELKAHDRWPFIKVVQNAYKVNCCERMEPNCQENALQENPNYVLQTYRYETRTSSIKPVLVEGAWGALSGVSFFIFKDLTSQRLLRARAFTFYNECLSQDIFLKRKIKNCSTSLRVKHDEIVKDFDYSMEGINNLGKDLSL